LTEEKREKRDMFQHKYYVTKAPESEGIHFVHNETCQVLPDQEMEELGTFDACEEPVAAAKQKYDPVNGCALCCSDCYEKG